MCNYTVQKQIHGIFKGRAFLNILYVASYCQLLILWKKALDVFSQIAAIFKYRSTNNASPE